MNVKSLLILPFAATLALSAGCTAQPVEKEAVSLAEIAVVSSTEAFGTTIDLNQPDMPVEGVSYTPGNLVIEQAGVYRLSGRYSGRVTVNAPGAVELILAGVDMTGAACLDILSSDPVTLTLEAGTMNRLWDGADQADKSAQATLFSKAPLTIDGQGSLTVIAGANNGIQAKDDLTIAGGSVTVTAANHALKSKGLLTLAGGIVSLTAQGDALTAEAGRVELGDIVISGGQLSIYSDSNAINADNMVTISGGELNIESLADGIRGVAILLSGGRGQLNTQTDGVQATDLLTVSGGVWDITTGGGGGSASSKSGDNFGPSFGSQQSQQSDSSKGLKSDSNISITGGTLHLNTADDSIHCGLLCTIDDGDIEILSSDDAIHADDMLVINGGNVNISDCFEGLEAFAIEVTGGDILIRSVNDGINANGSEGFGFGGPGSRSQQSSSTFDSISGQSVTYFRQSGGSIDLVITGSMNNAGDGVDSNGAVTIDGGILTVSTLGNTQEGGIDIGQGDLTINGGMVMAGGASMMQENISTSSAQCSALVKMNTQPAGTVVTITDSQGQEIWSVTMTNVFNCLVLSHPDLQPGQVYTVTYGSESTTLDFTSTNVINPSGGFGFGGGFPGGFGGRP